MHPNFKYLRAQVHALLSSFMINPSGFRSYNSLFNESLFFDPLDKWFFKEIKRLDSEDMPLDEDFFNYGENENEAEARREHVFQILGTMPGSGSESYCLEVANNLICYQRYKQYIHLANNLEYGHIDFLEYEQKIQQIFNLKEKAESSTTLKNKLDINILSPYLKSAFLTLKSVNHYPDSMVLVTLLSALGGLIGARAKIYNGANVSVYPVIWGLIIAPSSVAAKSTLFEYTKKLIFGDIEKEFENDYQEARKEYLALSESERPIEQPGLKQIIFPIDSTPEAKIKALMHNQNGGIVFHDELKAELEKCNQNLGYKALKTSLFDGRKYKKELVSSGAIILQHPCLSEVGAITQQWFFEAFRQNDLISGFLARYLFSYNVKDDFKPLESKKIHFNASEFVAISKRFLETYGFNNDTLHFELDQQAQDYYQEWFNELSKAAFETESDEELAMTYRLTTYALKFTLISYIMNNINKNTDIKIPLSYLKEGIAIMDYFRAESDRTLRAFKDSGKINIEIDSVLKKIIKKLRKEGGMVLSRTLCMNLKGVTRDILNSLVESGEIIEVNIDGSNYIKLP